MPNTVTKVLILVMALAIVAYASYMIGAWVYDKGYQNGYNSSFYTIRVTHVEQQPDNGYLVLIRDMNDELYMHYCNR